MRRSRSPSAPPARAASVSGDGSRGNGSSGGLLPVCAAPAGVRARTPKASGFVGGSTPFRSRGACRRLCGSGRTQKCCLDDRPRHHHPYCPRAWPRQPSTQTRPPRSKLKSCQPRGGRGLPRSGHRAAEPSSRGTPLHRTLPLRGKATTDPPPSIRCRVAHLQIGEDETEMTLPPSLTLGVHTRQKLRRSSCSWQQRGRSGARGRCQYGVGTCKFWVDRKGGQGCVSL